MSKTRKAGVKNQTEMRERKAKTIAQTRAKGTDRMVIKMR